MDELLKEIGPRFISLELSSGIHSSRKPEILAWVASAYKEGKVICYTVPYDRGSAEKAIKGLIEILK